MIIKYVYCVLVGLALAELIFFTIRCIDYGLIFDLLILLMVILLLITMLVFYNTLDYFVIGMWIVFMFLTFFVGFYFT